MRAIRALPILFAMLAKFTAAFQPIGTDTHSTVLIVNTIWVYGGEYYFKALNNLYSLDVSLTWPCTAPAWTDHSSDGSFFSAPKVAGQAMWVSADKSSFYIWGGGN